MEHTFGSIVQSFNHLVFIVCQVESYRNILILSSDQLLLPNIKLFQETKIGLELVSLPHFLYDFENEKSF